MDTEDSWWLKWQGFKSTEFSIHVDKHVYTLCGGLARLFSALDTDNQKEMQPD